MAKAALSSSDLVASSIDVTLGNLVSPKTYLLIPSSVALDSLVVNSRQLRVGLGTTVADSALKVGNTVTQLNSGATGNLISTAGIATGAYDSAFRGFNA